MAGLIRHKKSPEDALDILYRLLPKVPDAQLTMVGEVNEETLSRFSARAEELGLTEHLSFPGFSNDVFSEYEKADVFLITSNFEGFPWLSPKVLHAECQLCAMKCHI